MSGIIEQPPAATAAATATPRSNSPKLPPVTQIPLDLAYGQLDPTAHKNTRHCVIMMAPVPDSDARPSRSPACGGSAGREGAGQARSADA
jgi:hypothetical protein